MVPPAARRTKPLKDEVPDSVTSTTSPGPAEAGAEMLVVAEEVELPCDGVVHEPAPEE